MTANKRSAAVFNRDGGRTEGRILGPLGNEQPRQGLGGERGDPEWNLRGKADYSFKASAQRSADK